ncbi:MAG: hypothetical protein JJU34_10590 [Lunatimonas sp.]|uniref:anti-sigma factor family protein n=1 Tax=Lunatimonas sp. TaxID=2060141 RepID=UPI00263AC026|nr:hypothetical protein [Lunatimonas sp.]MCC5937721.1 hypothetical protein [Lunatimonas sp.]
MSFVPDETTWMGYLYGELDAETHLQVTQYLQNNPDARRELEQFASLRQRLKGLEDKSPPPMALPELPQTTRPVRRTIPKPIQYAATLVIALVCLMVAARATELHLQWSSDGLYISFGIREMPPTPQMVAATTLAEERAESPRGTYEASPSDSLLRQVQEIIDRKLDQRLRDEKQQWIGQIGPGLERRMDAYFQAARQEQALQLATYWEEVALVQKQYTEVLLQDFSQTLEQLREEDLVFLLERLNGMQYENEQRQQEINDLLIFLLAESDTSTPKQP